MFRQEERLGGEGEVPELADKTMERAFYEVSEKELQQCASIPLNLWLNVELHIFRERIQEGDQRTTEKSANTKEF